MVANKRKILVTGATGQQGSALARLLLQKNMKSMRLCVDVASLHKQYPEVNWLTFKDWVKSQNWEGLADVLYKFKNMT